MSTDSSNNDIRTKAIVLRRTNFGEADRVINFLTEQGVIAAIAKGVRKEKSKLAGAVELFTVSDITLHKGLNNKLCVLTSAKMLEHYDQIVYKLPELELAGRLMKKLARFAETSTGPEYFDLLHQILAALDAGVNPELVETWFWFNLAKTNGEQINLIKDTDGHDLDSFKTYVWDSTESALREQLGGNVSAEEIKLMRLMLSNTLKTTSRVKDIAPHLPTILYIAKMINKE
ncbi:DNA repair protein RecO [Candidatus Saccharibacteria bacterium]|nr:DNA repair protein RecO [Candidatus Saccharibacteria bacterium]MBR6122244.1 DNA repair protein RecO [Candidatus Saccharibacteria bacterium]